MHLGVSARHVYRLWAEYRVTGRAHVQGKPGRPGKEPDASLVRAVLAEHDANGTGAVYTARRVRKKRHISYRAAYRIMREAGRIEPSEARSRRRSWVRYERRHSNALWHTGWHVMRDPRFSGMNLVVVLDDASRCAVAARPFGRATSRNSVIAMRSAIAAFGKPAAVLSDNGPCFVGGGVRRDSPRCRRKPTLFEAELQRRCTRPTASSPYHPQTNGRPEKFLRSLEREIRYRRSLAAYIRYYDEDRLHGSLDIDSYETPLMAFRARKASRAIRKKNPNWADEDIGGGAT